MPAGCPDEWPVTVAIVARQRRHLQAVIALADADLFLEAEIIDRNDHRLLWLLDDIRYPCRRGRRSRGCGRAGSAASAMSATAAELIELVERGLLEGKLRDSELYLQPAFVSITAVVDRRHR